MWNRNACHSDNRESAWNCFTMSLIWYRPYLKSFEE
jgi:hypothetical protein